MKSIKTSKKSTKFDENLLKINIGVRELASYLGISVRRIQQLSKAGILPKTQRGKYELFTCLRAYLRYLRRLAKSYFGLYREHLKKYHDFNIKTENVAFFEDITAKEKEKT